MTTISPARPSRESIRHLHFIDGDESQIRPLDANAVSYFEVFGLEPRLTLDLDEVREAFLDLSRRFHPDYFATEEDESLREESLRRSSLVNNAWKTLRDPQKRAEYLISLHGKGIESNKNAVPSELLEEMFEIQEAGEELREARLAADEEALEAAEAKVRPLREQVKESRAHLLKELEDQFARFDQKIGEGAPFDSEDVQKQLQQIRLTLDQMNYLRTVLRNLK